jgi:hypothetical protein
MSGPHQQRFKDRKPSSRTALGRSDRGLVDGSRPHGRRRRSCNGSILNQLNEFQLEEAGIDRFAVRPREPFDDDRARADGQTDADALSTISDAALNCGIYKCTHDEP